VEERLPARASKPALRRAVAASLIVLFALVLAPTAAHADGNYGSYVDGIDGVGNDWGDNPEVCYGCGNSYNTDVVTLWQLVLVADGFLSPFKVDGQFGPITKEATKQWQGWRTGLKVDGKVGPLTWGKADDALTSQVAYEPPWSGSLLVSYRGRQGFLRLRRGNPHVPNPTEGTYQLVDGGQVGCPDTSIKYAFEPLADTSISTVTKTFGIHVWDTHYC
jgi:hypothetical protein